MVPAQGLVTVLFEPDLTKLVYVLHDGRRVRLFEQDIGSRGALFGGHLSFGKAAAG